MLQIKAQANNTAEILIYDQIGEGFFTSGVTAKEIAGQLKALGDVTEIIVRINSPGGSVFDGLAIHNALRAHGATISVMIDGLAASIAASIAMAGDTISMADNALIMIHDPSSLAMGNAEELRKHADILDKVKENIVNGLSNRSGQTKQAISDMLTAETWLNAQEAADLGLIDEITPAMQVAACAKLDYFGNSPVKPIGNKADAAKRATIMPNNDPASVKVDAKQVAADTLKAEQARRVAVRALFTNFNHPELLESCLDDPSISEESASKILLQAEGDRNAAQALAAKSDVRIVEDSRDKLCAGITTAIEGRISGKREKGNEFNGSSMIEMGRKCLEISGFKTAGLSRSQLAGAIFAQHTTSDFPNILENIAGKELLQGYEEAPDTFSVWVRNGSVSDFKSNSRLRLGSFNTLATVNEAGEYTGGSLGENKETIQAVTKGRIIGFSRQMLINDDLGAFTGVATRMGEAARRTLANDVYSVITTNGNMSDGVALFHATHSNLATAAALSVTSLDSARAQMAKQTEGGNTLDIRPTHLLTGVELFGLAKELMESEGAPELNKNARVINRVNGMAAAVADPRLGATEFYLVKGNDFIEVAFLDGQQTPFIDSRENFDTDGIDWKVRFEYGVAAIDFRTAYKNAGV